MTPVALRPLNAAELGWLLDVERGAIAGGYVKGDSEAEHAARLELVDCRYLVAEEDGAAKGYAILRGLERSDRAIELKRIVVAEPGGGRGQRMLQALIAYAFGELGARRFWLDVLTTNARAQHVYEKLGFIQEGVQRNATVIHGAPADLILYGMAAPAPTG